MTDLITININDLPDTIGPPPQRAMIDSVRRYGVLIPIIVSRNDDGSYNLVAGNRRVASLRSLGFTEYHIPAVVVDRNLNDTITLIENELRSDNFAAQTQAVVRMFAADMTKAEITALTGMTKATIERHLTYGNANNKLRDAFTGGHIASTVMDAIAKCTPAEQDTLAVMYSGRGKITGTDVKTVQEATKATLLDEDTVLNTQVITHRPITYTELRERMQALADEAQAAGFTLDQLYLLLVNSPAYAREELAAF